METETKSETKSPSPPTTNRSLDTLRRGGCHCGTVRFEVAVDLSQPGSRCNCSVCTKTAVTSKLVKPSAFTLLAGEDALTSYVWGYQISRRFFCRQCGVHCFGRGFLEDVGGDYVAVNLNCLDDFDPALLSVIYWDGRHDNWEAGPRATPWPVATPPATAQVAATG